MKKVMQWLKTNFETAKIIVKNVSEFIDALALSGVSGYAIYSGMTNSGFWYGVLRYAGLLIALQAFVLLVRHFNKKG